MAEIIVVGVVVLAVVAALVTMSIKAMNATGSWAEARVAAQKLESELAIANATIATKTNEADSERKRADALDNALTEAEQDLTANPSGALDRLFARWHGMPHMSATAANPAAVGDPSKVPPPSPSATPGDDRDRLLKPGE